MAYICVCKFFISNVVVLILTRFIQFILLSNMMLCCFCTRVCHTNIPFDCCTCACLNVVELLNYYCSLVRKRLYTLGTSCYTLTKRSYCLYDECTVFIHLYFCSVRVTLSRCKSLKLSRIVT